MLIAAACGNSGSSKGTQSTIPPSGGSTTTVNAADLTKNVPSTAPGVTEHRDQGRRGPHQDQQPDRRRLRRVADGIKAYFAMINDAGGIYGRKLVLANVRDDQFGQNAQVTAAEPRLAPRSRPSARHRCSRASPRSPRRTSRRSSGTSTPSSPGTTTCSPTRARSASSAPVTISRGVAKQLGATKIGVIAYGVVAVDGLCDRHQELVRQVRGPPRSCTPTTRCRSRRRSPRRSPR